MSPVARGTIREEGVPALILDILESWWGCWFTPEEIAALVTEIRPETPYRDATVGRAVHRLIDQGRVDRRLRPGELIRVLEIRRTARSYLDLDLDGSAEDRLCGAVADGLGEGGHHPMPTAESGGSWAGSSTRRSTSRVKGARS